MKTLSLVLNLGLVFAGALASAAGVESSISGFKLVTCTGKNSCAVVTAEKTQGSQLKMLHTLVNPEVKITVSGKTTSFKGDSGYVDMDENQLVLFKRISGVLQETAVNLSTLEITAQHGGSL
ncbi:hypothetical protein ACLVWU_01770 [Bdellovibrio sp. HCB290]|uniref:hypothetical protein n=1 Tax=Bdellovibrio sp. HCB290 TaxID=3394356 RepID=UPI0039B378B5